MLMRMLVLLLFDADVTETATSAWRTQTFEADHVLVNANAGGSGPARIR